jgi:heme oxygenase (biliverdin-producing, ferredoxin)
MDSVPNIYSGSAPSSSDQQTGLSELFKSHTTDIHKEVEGHLFVKKFRDSTLPKEAYHQHITDLHHVYSFFENEFASEMKREMRLQQLNFQGLPRAKYLDKDLKVDSFQGLSSAPSAAAIEYVSHLRSVSMTKPILLLAHSYVRYLGDLSGGMILKKLISKMWPDAVNFYDFQELLFLQAPAYSTPVTFKTLYKLRLDNLTISPAERDLLLAEVTKAFELSGALFEAAVPTKKT